MMLESTLFYSVVVAALWCVAFQPPIWMRLFQMASSNKKLSIFHGNLGISKFHFLNNALLFSVFYLLGLLYSIQTTPLIISVPLMLILLQLSLFDMRYYWLPDRLILPLIPIALFLSLQEPATMGLQAVYGGIVGFVLFFLPRLIFNKIKKQDTLGIGDIKLGVAMGAWLGFAPLSFAVSLSCALALCYAIIAKMLGVKPVEKIALGVFLCIGFWLAYISKNAALCSAC